MSDLAQIAADIGRAIAVLTGNTHYVCKSGPEVDSLTVTKDGFLNCLVRLQRLRDWVEGRAATNRQGITPKILAQSAHIRSLTQIAQTFRTQAYALPTDRDGMIPRQSLVGLLERFARDCEDEAENYAAGCEARARELIRDDWKAMPCADRLHNTATQFHAPGTPCPLPSEKKQAAA